MMTRIYYTRYLCNKDIYYIDTITITIYYFEGIIFNPKGINEQKNYN